MGVLRNIVLAVLGVSLITFIALFGQLPALRRTPIGFLQRLLCLHIPNGIKNVDRTLTGGQLTERGARLGHYLFYVKNPVVLILFLILLTGSAVLFTWNASSRLPRSLLYPLWPLISLPYIFTYLCVTHKAHYITHSNHDLRMRDYPYDHMLYWPYKACATCRLAKPARSKHCSLCGFCVAKCDHHCVWVNNCLGRGNYRYFLALLLFLGILQIYGAYLSWWILSPRLRINPTNPFFSYARLENLGQAFVIAVSIGGISIAGVGLLAASTASLPLGLLAYHVYLIWAGMTTNESQKWSDWKEDMADGIVFRADRKALKAHNQLRKRAEKRPVLDPLDDDDDAEVFWPVQNSAVLAQTSDGKPPQGQEALWTRVWDLKDITNVYDLGAWQNLMEVLRER